MHSEGVYTITDENLMVLSKTECIQYNKLDYPCQKNF